MLLFIVFKFGVEKKSQDVELVLNEYYIVKFHDSVHDTIDFVYFVFPNKIKYFKGDTIKYINSTNYTLDTVVIYTFKFNYNE